MKKTKNTEHEDLDQQDEKPQEQPYQNVLINATESNFVSFSLSKEELTALTNLLGVGSKTFESLALQAAQQNDEEMFKFWSARQKLSNLFISRLIEFYKMPEPISKELH